MDLIVRDMITIRAQQWLLAGLRVVCISLHENYENNTQFVL
jgi:hypothetical protein